LPKTFFLELEVTYRQYFVDDQDLGLEVRRDGKASRTVIPEL